MSECPCGSGKNFDKCCGPLLEGKSKAESPEAMMRARYTAYVRHDADYLYKSSGPEIKKEFDRGETLKWSESADWKSLEIHSTEAGGPSDVSGKVEFTAHYEIDGQAIDHHELASFEKIDGEWAFTDSYVYGRDPIRRDAPKVGRNDPCPCGSGKKYKKCCGK